MTNTAQFAGKRALVTGSTRGLGRTTAEWLAREGADVFVHGRNQNDVDCAIEELSAFGTTIQGATADLTDVKQVHRLATTALEMAAVAEYLSGK